MAQQEGTETPIQESGQNPGSPSILLGYSNPPYAPPTRLSFHVAGPLVPPQNTSRPATPKNGQGYAPGARSPRDGRRVYAPRGATRQLTPLPDALESIYRATLERRMIEPERVRHADQNASPGSEDTCVFHIGTNGHMTGQCTRLRHCIQDWSDDGFFVITPEGFRFESGC